MKKKLRSLSLVLVMSCSVIALTRCSKSPANHFSQSPSSNSFASSDTIPVIQNSNNSYDFVGALHNGGIRKYLSGIIPDTGNPKIDSIVRTDVGPFMTTYGMSIDSFNVFYNRGVNDGIYPFSRYPSLDSNALYYVGLLSAKGNSYLQKLYKNSITYMVSDTPSATQYANFANSAITLENAIIVDSSLSSNEKVALLSSFSVARYSTNYWSNFVIENKLWPGWLSQVGNGLQGWFKGLPYWGKVGVSDVGGALAGGLLSKDWRGALGGGLGVSLCAAVSL